MKRVAIIGGGVIGLFSAYYLNKAGHKVTIFDQGNLLDNGSLGNAGMIVPSHIIPLASPGMISKGIRWMFHSQSPFYVKPRLNGDLLRWGYKFYKHATHEHVQRSIPALRSISSFSKTMYQQIVHDNPFHMGYQEKGLLMLYQTMETEKEEAEAARLANKHGIEAYILSNGEVQKLEPEIKVNVSGGVYYPGDAHLMPQHLIKNLIEFLKRQGVAIFSETKVADFEVHDKMILSMMMEDDPATQTFDEYILATGAWSSILSSRLKIVLPLQSGKGYSFTLKSVEKQIHIPSILLEGRVAVTPMDTSLRFGGTMEINGIDRSINMQRVRGIVNTVAKFYPELNIPLPDRENIWHGLRPCSPDGLPYIGHSSLYKNLIIATGHGMMGLSLGPGTGKLVAELVDKQKTSIPIDPFIPHRHE